MLRPLGFTNPDTAGLEAQIADAHAAAEDAKDAAANARDMVLRRDPRLTALESDTVTLKQVAATVGELSAESTADRKGLHDAVDSLMQQMATIQTTPGPAGKSAYQLARDAGYGGTQTQWLASLKGDKGDPGTPADMTRVTALETAVTALQNLKVTVGFGVATLPASLAAGAVTNVVVNLSRNMGSATYSVGYGLSGGTSLLGQLQAVGVTAQTATTVTVQVKNTGLTALANLATATVSVVAAKDA